MLYRFPPHIFLVFLLFFSFFSPSPLHGRRRTMRVQSTGKIPRAHFIAHALVFQFFLKRTKANRHFNSKARSFTQTRGKVVMATDKKTLEGVAKYLRFNLRTKAAVLRREKVEYFIGSAAVDTLMNSKWAVTTEEANESESKKSRKDGEGSGVEFHTRADAVSFCNYLIDLQYITRVNKVEVRSTTDTADTGDDEAKGKPGEQDTEQPPKKQSKTKSKAEDAKKKKKRYRLEVHKKQQFRDGEDLYIWKYNPPSMSTYVIGFVVVLGAVAWTLQPLWPASTRVAMWYVAMAAACIVGVLLVLLVLRWFLFGIIVVATLGKVHFWAFPNLNEEKYGFVDSFKPFYSVERSGDSDRE